MKRFDCHCHIFNIVNVGLKAVLEHFEDTDAHYEKLSSNFISDENTLFASHTHIKSKIKKIAELIRIFKNDSTKIFGMLDDHYNKEYTLFPLMFDGDFLLEVYDEADLSHIRSLIEEENSSNENSVLRQFKAIGENDSDVVLDFLNEFFIPKSKENKMLSTKKRGFEKQYDDIKYLKQNSEYKDRIVPFLGVDPRRENIKDYLPEVGEGKLFAGIKVYPPNGFSPMDKVLVGEDSIFEYCSNNQIPIVSHCSYGGFATPATNVPINGMIIPDGKVKPELFNGVYNFKTGLKAGFNTMVLERARVLNNPLIWEEVLKIYPNLILVLAHFGSGNDEWQDNILRMMKVYPNLYTDVSCMSNFENLVRVKMIYNTNPDIQNKILYGSDYYLDMFFNDSFNQYLNRIKITFGDTIFDELSSTNPLSFMGKWYK